MVDKVTVQSIATIKFMSDGAIDVSLTSANGVTARKLDTLTNLLYQKLNEVRAKERHKLAQATPAVKQLTENDNA